MAATCRIYTSRTATPSASPIISRLTNVTAPMPFLKHTIFWRGSSATAENSVAGPVAHDTVVKVDVAQGLRSDDLSIVLFASSDTDAEQQYATRVSALASTRPVSSFTDTKPI